MGQRADLLKWLEEEPSRLNDLSPAVRQHFQHLITKRQLSQRRVREEGAPTYTASRVELRKSVRAAAATGKNLYEIMDAFGLKASQVKYILKNDHRWKELKASRPRRSPSARNLEIIEAHSSGQTLETIGERFGISRERVRQIVKRHSLE